MTEHEYEYTVAAVIQSGHIDRDGVSTEPVSVQWYIGTDLARAVSALAGAAVNHRDVDERVPADARYRTLSVGMTIREIGPEFGHCANHDIGLHRKVESCREWVAES